MRKRILAVLICIIVLSNNAFAANNINIYIDGIKKDFNPAPIIEKGTTLVPLRQLFEILGSKVEWVDSTKTVIATKNSAKVSLKIGSLYGYINDKKVLLSAKPKLINEKTYIPLRFVSEAFGLEVFWDDINKTININNKNIGLYNTIDEQKYRLRQVFNFVNNGDLANVEFNVLLGCKSNSPYQKDHDLTMTPEPNEIYFDNNGNKFAKIKIYNLKKNEKYQIVTTKILTNSGIQYNILENNVIKEYDDIYKDYLKNEDKIETNDKRIIDMAMSLANNTNNPYSIAKKLFEYVNLNIKYDELSEYKNKGALSTLINKIGVCEDFSKLFVALLRANSIPSRSVVGFWIQEKQKSGINYDNWTDISQLGHEWPEFYIKGYGWIVSEPTFSYIYNGKKVVPWEQFANQNKNGHIIFSYNSSGDEYISWRAEGYGSLDINIESRQALIQKAR